MPIYCQPLGLQAKIFKNKQVKTNSGYAVKTLSPHFGYNGSIDFAAKGTGFPKKLLDSILNSNFINNFILHARRGKNFRITYSKELTHSNYHGHTDPIFRDVYTNKLKVQVSRNDEFRMVSEITGSPEQIQDEISRKYYPVTNYRSAKTLTELEEAIAKVEKENGIKIKLPPNIDQ